MENFAPVVEKYGPFLFSDFPRPVSLYLLIGLQADGQENGICILRIAELGLDKTNHKMTGGKIL